MWIVSPQLTDLQWISKETSFMLQYKKLSHCTTSVITDGGRSALFQLRWDASSLKSSDCSYYRSTSQKCFLKFIICPQHGPRWTQACWEMEFLQHVLGLASYQPQREATKKATPRQLHPGCTTPACSCQIGGEVASHWGRPASLSSSPFVCRLVLSVTTQELMPYLREKLQVNWGLYFLPHLSLQTMLKVIPVDVFRWT